jgi:hypothetical protein
MLIVLDPWQVPEELVQLVVGPLRARVKRVIVAAAEDRIRLDDDSERRYRPVRIRNIIVSATALLTAFVVPCSAEAPLPLELSDEIVASRPGPGRILTPVASFTDDSFVVAWEHQARGIAGRLFSPTGIPQTGQILLVADDPLPPIPFHQVLAQNREATVVGHPDGSFLLVWVREEVNLQVFPFFERRFVLDSEIVTQRFDRFGAPLGDRHPIGSGNSGFESSPALVGILDGEAIVAWRHEGVEGQGIWIRRVDADGAPVTEPLQVADEGRRPSLAAFEDGTALVLWDRFDETLDRRVLSARLIAPDGLPYGPTIDVTDGPVAVQTPPRVAASEGAFLVAWQGAPDEQGAPRTRIRGRLISVGGSFLGEELVISSDLGEAHSSPAVAANPGGPFLVSWMEWDRGFRTALWGSLVDGDGTVGEAVMLTHTTLAGQWVTSLEPGRDADFLASWLGFDVEGRMAVRARLLRHLDAHGCPLGVRISTRGADGC